MYVYVINTIWDIREDGTWSECRPAKRKAYTNFKECKKALIDHLEQYLDRHYMHIEEIERGEYSREQLLEFKRHDMISGYAVYDLVNTFEEKHEKRTRWLINRHKLE